jgi:hypothetical protein
MTSDRIWWFFFIMFWILVFFGIQELNEKWIEFISNFMFSYFR